MTIRILGFSVCDVVKSTLNPDDYQYFSHLVVEIDGEIYASTVLLDVSAVDGKISPDQREDYFKSYLVKDIFEQLNPAKVDEFYKFIYGN